LKTHKHIVSLLLLIILAGMAVAPARAQTVNVYAGQTSELAVVQINGDTYTWDLYDNPKGVNFASLPGNCPSGKAYFPQGVNTGSTVRVTWLAPGIYFYRVVARRFGCTMNVKIGKINVLEVLIKATISQPPPVCVGQTAKLSITLPGIAPWTIDVSDGVNTVTYGNNDITSNPFIINVSPSKTTTYTVTRVNDANGVMLMFSNSVRVIVNPDPYFKLYDRDTLYSGGPVMLNPGAFNEYKWQDGSTDPQLQTSADGLYSVTVTDNNGCKASASVFLRSCQLMIWMPNAFTPNGDGDNDDFKAVYNPEVVPIFKLLVFNKWGEQLYSSDDITKGWDGTYKGKPCPPDLYTWIIGFKAPEACDFLQKSPQQGTVMLLK
jgi:gliding motility-associated-like protein